MLVLTNLPMSCAENPHNITRRITLSLGYDPKYNSNEGMKHMPLTTIQAYSWAFDWVTKVTDGPVSRSVLVGADFILHMPYLGKEFNEATSNWFFEEKWWPYLPAYHEFGHGRGFKAFSVSGLKHYAVTVGGQTYTTENVWMYYFYSLRHGAFNNGAVTYGEDDVKKAVHLLPIYAGGLNNESRLSSEIANWVYRFNGHIAYFGAYLRGKIAPITYTAKTLSKVIDEDTGDIGHITKYYRGYYSKFNRHQIQYGGWASFLLSSTTYSFLKGIYDFIETGNPEVRTLVWKGFRLPDVNFYFTRNGLSLEVVTGYEINPNWWLDLGVETVYYPHVNSVEFTPSVRYVLPTSIYGKFEFDIGLVVNSHGHFSGNLGVEWTDPVNPFTVQAKLIHHNANTYVGERNIPDALNSDHDFEFMLAASINY